MLLENVLVFRSGPIRFQTRGKCSAKHKAFFIKKKKTQKALKCHGCLHLLWLLLLFGRFHCICPLPTRIIGKNIHGNSKRLLLRSSDKRAPVPTINKPGSAYWCVGDEGWNIAKHSCRNARTIIISRSISYSCAYSEHIPTSLPEYFSDGFRDGAGNSWMNESASGCDEMLFKYILPVDIMSPKSVEIR